MNKLFFTSIMLVLAIVASAKSYKIGPSSVTGMNFTSINAAMSYVSAGDTLLLDKAYKGTSLQTVTKAVVIIGNGFDTTTSTIAQISTLSLKADGIHVNSLYVTNVKFYNKDCRLYRCFVGSSAAWAGTSDATGSNSIHSCYFTGTIKGESAKAIFDIQNTILYTSTYNVINNLINSNICHCVIYGGIYGYGYSSSYIIQDVTSSNITDNIIVTINNYVSGDINNTISNYNVSSMNTIHHNVMSGFRNTTNYPLNRLTQSTSLSIICKCTGTTISGTYFELKSGSLAQNYASDGSDCGIYGGLYPYVDYGRPIYVPYFTNINVPAKATNGTLPISVTVEVQNK